MLSKTVNTRWKIKQLETNTDNLPAHSWKIKWIFILIQTNEQREVQEDHVMQSHLLYTLVVTSENR